MAAGCLLQVQLGFLGICQRIHEARSRDKVGIDAAGATAMVKQVVLAELQTESPNMAKWSLQSSSRWREVGTDAGCWSNMVGSQVVLAELQTESP